MPHDKVPLRLVRSEPVKKSSVVRLPQEILSEAKVLRDRRRAAIERLGEIDMAIAQLEMQRGQARQNVAREAGELNSCLGRGLAKLGIEQKKRSSIWTPER